VLNILLLQGAVAVAVAFLVTGVAAAEVVDIKQQQGFQ
jgi:hypothetical protein